jgi:hypothetical protein
MPCGNDSGIRPPLLLAAGRLDAARSLKVYGSAQTKFAASSMLPVFGEPRPGT